MLWWQKIKERDFYEESDETELRYKNESTKIVYFTI